MLASDEDILRAAEDWRKAGRGVALATVVVAGRPVRGSRMWWTVAPSLIHCRCLVLDVANPPVPRSTVSPATSIPGPAVSLTRTGHAARPSWHTAATSPPRRGSGD